MSDTNGVVWAVLCHSFPKPLLSQCVRAHSWQICSFFFFFKSIFIDREIYCTWYENGVPQTLLQSSVFLH